jgi:hypothetical protein
MAGDWIKLTHATLDKPEVRQTARMLGITVGDALLAYLRWWVWLDQNCVDGLVDHLVDQDVDDLLHTPGLAACMRKVGWLSTDPETGKLRVGGFEVHNGETAKKRALRNRKQANWRKSVDRDVDQDVDRPQSTKASTREEKRRGTTPPPSPSPQAGRGSGRHTSPKVNGHTAPKLPASWWTDPDKASAAGKVLGLTANPGETLPAFTGRIREALARMKQSHEH